MKDFNSMTPWGQMARCIVNPDHLIDGFLDPNNSNLYEDGTEVDWERVEAEGQNVMVQIPKFYFAKKKVEDIFYFGVSDKPIDDDYVKVDDWEIHPAFYRDITKYCDDNLAIPELVDHRYYGAFHGWVDSKGRLRSLPGKSPTTDKAIGTFRNHAKNMGVGWTQLDYYLRYAVQMLYLTEYGHPDSQTQIGRGFVDGNSAKTNTGGTLDKGNNTFGETTGKKQMSYRGIEDLYGNVRNWVDGFILNKPSQGNISIAIKGFNDNGTGYEKIGQTSNISGANIRHIRDEKELGFIPKTTGGSYENDGLYDYSRLSAGSLAQFDCCGGNWADGSDAGAFYFHANWNAASSYSNIGARLCL